MASLCWSPYSPLRTEVRRDHRGSAWPWRTVFSPAATPRVLRSASVRQPMICAAACRRTLFFTRNARSGAPRSKRQRWLALLPGPGRDNRAGLHRLDGGLRLLELLFFLAAVFIAHGWCVLSRQRSHGQSGRLRENSKPRLGIGEEGIDKAPQSARKKTARAPNRNPRGQCLTYPLRIDLQAA